MIKVALTWDVDGKIDSYSLYRSLSTIDSDDLPEPLATGLTSNLYIDTAIEEDTEYFYRVASIRNDIIKISDEVSVITEKGDEYWDDVKLLIFADAESYPSTNFIDSSNREVALTYNGTVNIINTFPPKYDDGTIFNQGGKINCDLGYGPGLDDFTLEFFFNTTARGGDWDRIFAIGNANTNGSLEQWLDTVGNSSLFYHNGNYYWLVGVGQLNLSTWYHVVVMRKDGVFYTFLDGVPQSVTASYNVWNNMLYIGADSSRNFPTNNVHFNSIRFTSRARYPTTGFTPSLKKFPSLG